MVKKLLIFSLLFGMAFPTFSQTGSQPSPEAVPGITASGNKIDGLELPPDQTVGYDEGFVTIQAKCKGEVKWLVISNVKIKYFTLNASNTVIVSVPPQGGVVTVFAVGLVEGKLTEFAKTIITVNGSVNPPGPNPPGPNPPPVGAPSNVTFIIDLNNSNPSFGQIINSQKIRDVVTSKNAIYRLYDPQNPILKTKGLTETIDGLGGAPVIIIQSSNGDIIAKVKMPATEAEVLKTLNDLLGSK